MADEKGINETIGRGLRLLREANGWSQREMARRIGRSSNAVYTLENAKTTLDVDDLFLMADLLDISPLEILQDLLTLDDLQRLNRVWQNKEQELGLSRDHGAEQLGQSTDHTRATYEILDGCTCARDDVDTLIGQRVRKAREAAGLTQAQLAALLDRSYNKIHNIEVGAVRVTVADAIRLGHHLGTSPFFLLQDVIEVTDVVELLRDLVNERDRLAVEASTAVQRFSSLDKQICTIQQVVSRKGSGQ